LQFSLHARKNEEKIILKKYLNNNLMFHARKKQGKAMLMRIFKSKFNFHHAREKMMLNFFFIKITIYYFSCTLKK
jgi:hypothetical protein